MAGDGSVSQPVKQDCNSVMMVRRCDLTLCLGVKAQPTPLRDAALQSKKFDLPRKNAEECFVVNPIELNGKKRCESLRAPHMLRDVEAMRYMQCEYHPPIGCPSLRTFDLIVFLLVFLVESDTSCSSW
mmetsp:Transcript_24246/g.50154  ORF Transcript_24246/g.50154 Transcript_24246/m.50154 type:complete len:128 (-) Transcript_24246:266-649(-)